MRVAPPFFAGFFHRFLFYFLKVANVFFISSLVFALSAAAAYWIVARQAKQPETHAPELTGLDVATALQTLHEQSTKDPALKEMGLSLKIDKMEQNDRVGLGRIISQHPRAGSWIKAGSALRVRVSLGARHATCPDTRGKNYTQAGILLRQADLAQGALSFVPNAAAEKDLVISQSPAPGAILSPGTPISLLVSQGPETPPVVMPNLEGLSPEQARVALESDGLRLAAPVATTITDKTEGLILRQEPPVGAIVSSGDAAQVVAGDRGE